MTRFLRRTTRGDVGDPPPGLLDVGERGGETGLGIGEERPRIEPIRRRLGKRVDIQPGPRLPCPAMRPVQERPATRVVGRDAAGQERRLNHQAGDVRDGLIEHGVIQEGRARISGRETLTNLNRHTVPERIQGGRLTGGRQRQREPQAFGDESEVDDLTEDHPHPLDLARRVDRNAVPEALDTLLDEVPQIQCQPAEAPQPVRPHHEQGRIATRFVAAYPTGSSLIPPRSGG